MAGLSGLSDARGKALLDRVFLFGDKSRLLFGGTRGAIDFVSADNIALLANYGMHLIPPLDETLFEICDRIVVIAKGTLSPSKVTSETGVEEIGIWMSGMWPDAEKPGDAPHVA